jgi:hypothetical protein
MVCDVTFELTETANKVLSQHSHLDLTEKIELVDQVIRGHGGYSDVYYGRFVTGGTYVAVKRLRVHIQKERQLSKACYTLRLLSHASFLQSGVEYQPRTSNMVPT